MRSTTRALTAAFAMASSALAAGCSGASSGPSPSNPGGLAALQSLRSGATYEQVSSGHLTRYSPGVGHFGRTTARPNPMVRPRADRGNLYVSDVTGDIVVLENRVYTPDGTITNGVSTPDGEWTDANKNLYVTNYLNNVVEYSCKVNKCGGTPTFTYSAGLKDPVNVTTDQSGNVFVADYENKSVNEYAQGSNTVLHQCSLPGPVTGAAVDSSTGDVFVAYDSTSSINAYIEEFTGGLAGCSGTVLSAPIDLTGDLILDNQKNIIVCDQWNAVVDVIAPPYSSINRTIGSGWVDPYQPALEKRGKKMLLYVEDSSSGPSGNGVIGVYDYPADTLVTTLKGNSSGPFKNPYGVTDTFNLVP
jgi:hypothetical protein